MTKIMRCIIYVKKFGIGKYSIQKLYLFGTVIIIINIYFILNVKISNYGINVNN